MNATHCFDANYEGVKRIIKKADENSRECKESSYEILKENLKFIDDVKEVESFRYYPIVSQKLELPTRIDFFFQRGEVVKNDLRGVELFCHSGDTSEMIICLTTELAKIEEDVKTFHDDVNKIKQTVKTVADYVGMQARKCFENIYDEARFNCEAAGRSHTGCVKKAIENAGKTRKISPKIVQWTRSSLRSQNFLRLVRG